MTDTLGPNELLAAGAAGAAVVLCGGLYALFLALGLTRGKRSFHAIAHGCGLLTGIALVALSWALHFDLLWNAVALFVYLAYLVSPHLIWRLTVATHAPQPADPRTASKSSFGRTS